MCSSKSFSGGFLEASSEKAKTELPIEIYQKKKVGNDQNDIIRLASIISNNDLDFILLLEAENGQWTHLRKHPQNRNGTHDYGLCGLNSKYHKPFIDSEDFKDPEKQLKYCYSVYQDALKRKVISSRFFGWNVRLKNKDKFFISTTQL